MVKHLSAMLETQVLPLGREDPLEKEMATHSSTLAWKIPWMRNLVGYSPWDCKESDMTERLYLLTYMPGRKNYRCNVITDFRTHGQIS